MCTDFLLPNNGQRVISGRTLDWETPLAADLFFVPAQQAFESLAPFSSADQPLRWKNRHRFVGIEFRAMALVEALGGAIDNRLHGTPQTKQMALIDGMNEQGLSAGLLWLPGSEFPAASSSLPNLAALHVATWMVGMFATVDEVLAGLQSVQIWSGFAANQSKAHYVVHDASGNTLVIEFLNGQLVPYHNQSQVLTNYPPLDWQLANLDTYINLTNRNVPQNVAGQELNGSGMLGLPADATPPSRFVRASYLKKFVPPQEAAQAGVEQALHLLNNVDVVQGEVRPSLQSHDSEPWKGDYTQWSVVRDHAAATYYFRTVDNLNLRQIAFSELNGSDITHISLSNTDSQWCDDISSSLN